MTFNPNRAKGSDYNLDGNLTLNGDLSIQGAATFLGDVGYRSGRPWIDVRAYGARGDGSTDDTTALQNALNAVPATGGKIYWPAGTYIVSSTLTVGSTSAQVSNLAWDGGAFGGPNLLTGVTLKWNGAAGGTVLTIQGVRDSLFQHFDIQAGTTTPAIAINLTTAAGATSTHNRFVGVGLLTGSSAALQIVDPGSLGGNDLHEFVGVSFNGGGTDDLLINSSNAKFIRLLNCNFTGAGTNGLHVGTNGGSFQGFACNFDSTLTGVAVKIEARTDTNTLVGCQFETQSNHPQYFTLPAGVGAFLALIGCRLSPAGITQSTTVTTVGSGVVGGLTLIGNDFSDGTYNTNPVYNLDHAVVLNNLFPSAAAGNFTGNPQYCVGNNAYSGVGTTIPWAIPSSTAVVALANSQALAAMNGSNNGTVKIAQIDGGGDLRLGDAVSMAVRPISDAQVQFGYSNVRFTNMFLSGGVNPSGNVSVTLGQGTPATTMTAGFPYLPSMTGSPTGVPGSIGGFAATVYDDTNRRLWVYSPALGAWKGVTLT
jgi:hypothetical protein